MTPGEEDDNGGDMGFWDYSPEPMFSVGSVTGFIPVPRGADKPKPREFPIGFHVCTQGSES